MIIRVHVHMLLKCGYCHMSGFICMGNERYTCSVEKRWTWRAWQILSRDSPLFVAEKEVASTITSLIV